MHVQQRSGWWIVPLLSVLSLGAAGGETPLIEAVKSGDVTTLSALMQQRVDVNLAEPDGTTALHWAAHRDDLGAADLLIGAGADVTAANRYGVTPLTLACINGNAAMLEKLLDAGADPNSSLPEGETVLMTAARTGKVDAVKVLLARGADVHAKDGWRETTALMWAAAEDNPATVEALLERGANIHERAKNGFTPLLFAAREGGIDTARALLAAGADPNDATPAERVLQLDVWVELDHGTSALVLAIINVNFELAALLLDKGADPNAADPRGSALHALAWVRRPGYSNPPPRTPTGNMDSLELAEALLVHGANPNVQLVWEEIRFDRNRGAVKLPPNISVGRNWLSFIGATPFYLAAKHCDVDLMRLLADNGADPTLATVQNVTPLMAAAGLGYWDGESPGIQNGISEPETLAAVKLAWELGNDVNAVTDYGDTPVEAQFSQLGPDGDGNKITGATQLEGSILLRRHPSNLTEFNPQKDLGDMRWGGTTALHGAVLRDAASVVEFLVEKGARLDVRSELGWTPLVLAQGVFSSNTVKEFTRAGEMLRRLMTDRGLDPELYGQTGNSDTTTLTSTR